MGSNDFGADHVAGIGKKAACERNKDRSEQWNEADGNLTALRLEKGAFGANNYSAVATKMMFLALLWNSLTGQAATFFSFEF